MPRSSTSKRSAVLRTLASPARAAASQHGRTVPQLAVAHAAAQSSPAYPKSCSPSRPRRGGTLAVYVEANDGETESCRGALLPSHTRLRARLRVPLIIQASRSPGAKVRASSGVGFSNHSSQAVRRRAARRRAARRRAVRRRGARWPCLRLPPRAAHSRPPPPRVRRPSPALPTGSWLQRRAALQRRRHRLRQASRKLHQIRRHPTLLGFRTTSSRGTERVSAARAPWSPSRRGKACRPSTRISFMFVSTTVTETIYALVLQSRSTDPPCVQYRS